MAHPFQNFGKSSPQYHHHHDCHTLPTLQKSKPVRIAHIYIYRHYTVKQCKRYAERERERESHFIKIERLRLRLYNGLVILWKLSTGANFSGASVRLFFINLSAVNKRADQTVLWLIALFRYVGVGEGEAE